MQSSCADINIVILRGLAGQCRRETHCSHMKPWRSCAAPIRAIVPSAGIRGHKMGTKNSAPSFSGFDGAEVFQLYRVSSVPGANRTRNPQLRRLVLYPVELRARKI